MPSAARDGRPVSPPGRRRRSSRRRRRRRLRAASSGSDPSPPSSTSRHSDRRSRRGTEGASRRRSVPPPQQRLRAASPRPPAGDRSFDCNDLAPEDRALAPPQQLRQLLRPEFSPYVPVVRGTLRLEGVNYAKFETARARRGPLERFLNALRDDVICEVGNGVRREDILFRIAPGAIRTVVLSFSDDGTDTGGGGPPPPGLGGTPKIPHGTRRREHGGYRGGGGGSGGGGPKLLDADWAVKLDYAIRSRSVRSQQCIALAMYTALADAGEFAAERTRQAYVEEMDPAARPGDVVVLSGAVDGSPPRRRDPPPPPLSPPPHPRSPPLSSPVAAALLRPPDRGPQTPVFAPRSSAPADSVFEVTDYRKATPIEVDGQRGIAVFIPESRIADFSSILDRRPVPHATPPALSPRRRY